MAGNRACLFPQDISRTSRDSAITTFAERHGRRRACLSGRTFAVSVWPSFFHHYARFDDVASQTETGVLYRTDRSRRRCQMHPAADLLSTFFNTSDPSHRAAVTTITYSTLSHRHHAKVNSDYCGSLAGPRAAAPNSSLMPTSPTDTMIYSTLPCCFGHNAPVLRWMQDGLVCLPSTLTSQAPLRLTMGRLLITYEALLPTRVPLEV